MARPGVYVTESVLPTPVAEQAATTAAGALVAPLPAGPAGPVRVTSWYQFSQLFGGLDSNELSTFAANMFFRAGGRELYVCRVVKSDAVAATVNLKAADNTTNWVTFVAKSAGTYGNSLRILLTKNAADLYDLQVVREAGVAGVTTDDDVLETFYDLDLATFGSTSVTNAINVRSNYISVAYDAGAEELAISAAPSIALVLSGGTDGSSGTLGYAAALTSLEAIDRSFVLFAPGVVETATIDAMTTFAEANGGFVVADTASGLTPAQAVTYAGTLTKSDHTAVYYPHLWVPDPTAVSRDAIVAVPPSGAVAGTILATDATTGVFKAPAGLETALGGVVALERSLTATELDSLNNDTTPVNAIRVVAGVGPAIMGARTLDQAASTRYINIRRSLSYLNREMKNSLEFAVFRNNDAVLWGQMRTVLDSFLTGFWSAGGLRGGTKAQAFYVKIDSQNNSPADVANGIVNVEVGVALQYPAEFIKIKLTQQTQS
jgi:uncharacterized protein